MFARKSAQRGRKLSERFGLRVKGVARKTTALSFAESGQVKNPLRMAADCAAALPGTRKWDCAGRIGNGKAENIALFAHAAKNCGTHGVELRRYSVRVR